MSVSTAAAVIRSSLKSTAGTINDHQHQQHLNLNDSTSSSTSSSGNSSASSAALGAIATTSISSSTSGLPAFAAAAAAAAAAAVVQPLFATPFPHQAQHSHGYNHGQYNNHSSQQHYHHQVAAAAVQQQQQHHYGYQPYQSAQSNNSLTVAQQYTVGAHQQNHSVLQQQQVRHQPQLHPVAAEQQPLPPVAVIPPPQHQLQSQLRSSKHNAHKVSKLTTDSPNASDFARPTNGGANPRKRRRGVIEKKRRDRINTSLTELRRLVPAAFEKRGSHKLEKAEILQLTVEHLRTLHAKGYEQSNDPRVLDYHNMGFRECVAEVTRFLTQQADMDANNPLRARLMGHLHCFAANRDQIKQQHHTTAAAAVAVQHAATWAAQQQQASAYTQQQAAQVYSNYHQQHQQFVAAAAAVASSTVTNGYGTNGSSDIAAPGSSTALGVDHTSNLAAQSSTNGFSLINGNGVFPPVPHASQTHHNAMSSAFYPAAAAAASLMGTSSAAVAAHQQSAAPYQSTSDYVVAASNNNVQSNSIASGVAAYARPWKSEVAGF